MRSQSKIVVFSRYGSLGASSRHRVLKFLPSLEKKGWGFYTQCFLPDSVLKKRYQGESVSFLCYVDLYLKRILFLIENRNEPVFWIQKELLPFLPYWIEAIFLKGKKVVFDIDDAVFVKYEEGSSWKTGLFRNKYRKIFRRSELVVAGNQFLAKRAVEAGSERVEILPTTLDPYSEKSSHNNERPVIVWIGTPSTEHYLEFLRPILQELSETEGFLFRVIGGTFKSEVFDCEVLAWDASKEEGMLASADIGIMPIPDKPWEQGKCGFKLVQYMAVGLPLVASPVGMNKDIVESGENGFLAATEAEWLKALRDLVKNRDLRSAMGQRSIQCFLSEYDSRIAVETMDRVFTDLLSTKEPV